MIHFPSHRVFRRFTQLVLFASLMLPLTTFAADPSSTDAATTTDHIKRIASNFASLSMNHWPDAAKFVGYCALNAFLWGALLFLLGLVVSIALYLRLLRRGFFDAPWRWYRLARWSWAVIIIGCISLGMLAAGATWGLQRQFHHAILHDHALDRITGHMIIAIYMDAADYQLTGDESAAHIQKIIDDSSSVSTLATADLHTRFYELAASEQTGWRKYLFRWFGHRYVSDKINDLLNVDPRAAFVLFLSPNIDQYLADHPDAKVGVVMFSRQLESLRTLACKGVNMLLGPWIASALALGVGIPLLLLIALRIAVRCTRPQPSSP